MVGAILMHNNLLITILLINMILTISPITNIPCSIFLTLISLNTCFVCSVLLFVLRLVICFPHQLQGAFLLTRIRLHCVSFCYYLVTCVSAALRVTFITPLTLQMLLLLYLLLLNLLLYLLNLLNLFLLVVL